MVRDVQEGVDLPDCPATLQSRVALMLQAEKDPAIRQAILRRASWDYKWFVDFFVDTYDPRLPGSKTIPLLLYPFQRELLDEIHRHVEGPADLLIEKSRTMGATWVIAAYSVWRWLFVPGTSVLFGSFKEQEVDNRTVSSLFGKLDFILRRLPGWMMPTGFNWRRHRRKMIIENPANGSVIEGDSATGDFSRSGRHTFIFIDEGATWTYLEDAWAAASQTSPCRIIVSTPKGQNDFWRIRNQEMGQIDVLTLHWTLHPLYDDQWYAEQRARMSAVMAAQELDINYERSAEGLVYPTWHDVPKGDYPYVPGWPLWISIDFGVRDATALVVWQQDPESGRFRMIDCYHNQGKPIDFYVPFLLGRSPDPLREHLYSKEDLAWLSRRSLWGPAIIYGDPASANRSATDARSIQDILLNEFGIYVVTNNAARDFETRARYTEVGLRTTDVSMPACELVHRAMSNARYRERKSGSQKTTEDNKPIHDWTADFRSAVEYFYVNVPGVIKERRRVRVVQRRRPWQDLYR